MTNIIALNNRSIAAATDRSGGKPHVAQVEAATADIKRMPVKPLTSDATGAKLAAALWDLRALQPSQAQAGAAPEDEFSKLANMSLAERIRYQVLGDKGLTEGDLAGMPPEQRQAIEKEIRDAVKRLTGEDDEARQERSSESTIDGALM